MHDDAQTQERNKTEKHAQRNERGESLKAYTKMKVRKLRSLQNISYILNRGTMHDETQNQERDKVEKHDQGYGIGGSLKACTK